MKRIVSLVLTLIMLSACSLTCAQEVAPAQWINSTVVGNVNEDTPTNVREDFHLFNSKDWFLKTELTDSKATITFFSDFSDQIEKQLRGLLEGELQENHDARQAQIYYQQYVDMKTRNKLGMAPLLPYVQEIEAISTMDELDVYLVKQETFTSLMDFGVDADIMDSAQNVTYIGQTNLSLSDADEYQNMTDLGKRTKDNQTIALQAMLERCGYSPEAAAACIEGKFAFEYALAGSIDGKSVQKQPDYLQKCYNPVTLEELETIAPRLPMKSLLARHIEAGAERFILQGPNWLAKLNELYTQENLENIKAFLICQTALVGMDLLDQACVDISNAYVSAMNGMEYHSDIQEDAYDLCSVLFGMAIGKLYADAYGAPEVNARVRELIDQVIAVFRSRLEKNDWLGEETRELAIAKLNKLRVRVGYPEDWAPYEAPDLTLKTVEEGGSLLDSTMLIGKHLIQDNLDMLSEPVDKEKWIATPQTVNAYYNPLDNSINIPSAIIAGFFGEEQPSQERMIGSIGTIIGHEITHGFDTMGSQFDADGNLQNWWTDEDRAAFSKCTQKVETYYNAIQVLPGKYVDGLLTIGETVADLGGMSCMLEIAKTVEGFDYNEFFSCYADIWRMKTTPEMTEVFLTDSHAPNYLRTNVVVQQFEEFYQTYGVQPGDGMYLAPEARLTVW